VLGAEDEKLLPAITTDTLSGMRRDWVEGSYRSLIGVIGVSMTFVVAAVTLTPTAYAAERAQSTADLIATLQPAVVNLSVTRHTKTGDNGNVAGQAPIVEQQAQSSGFFIDPAGVIATNRHVITGATEIIATLHDGTRLRAHVLSEATRSDLALLKVNAVRPVPTLRFGDSDRLRPGDPVLVIGNPIGLGSTVTAGIVSALDRVKPESEAGSFFQIDAPLNMGNSGGPVFDMEGEVVGVSTAFATSGSEGGSVGLGFAIPSNETRVTIDHLRADGRDSLGWIGVHVQSLTEDMATVAGLPDARASIITRIDDDSPAAWTGLEAGDIILRIGGENVPEPRLVARKIAGSAIGSVVQITVWRGGEQLTLPTSIAEFPHKGAPVASVPPAEPRAASRDLGLVLASIPKEVRAKLGMTDQEGGVLVEEVIADSIASDRGMMPGTAIVKVGKSTVNSPAEAQLCLQNATHDSPAFILVLIQDAQGRRWLALPWRPA